MQKAVFLFLCYLITIGSYAQKQSVSGHIYDADSLIPISGVNITIVGSSSGGISGDDGFFELEVETLPVLLYFSHVSYAINQALISKKDKNEIEVYLQKETTELGEVTISAERIQKVDLGDTLNVLDFSVFGNRMIIVGSPFRKTSDQRLYLTDLMGEQIDNFPVANVGKQIKIPEHMTPEHMYLFEDYLGSFHLLTRKNVRQIDLYDDSIKLTYTTYYPEFLKYLFPIKAMLGESLFFQISNRTKNSTFRSGPDAFRPLLVKTVNDPDGFGRYIQPPTSTKQIYKYVSAPIVALGDELLIFDFFDNHIETFDSLGVPGRKVPIDFHNYTYRYFFNFFTATDLNQKKFKQEIFLDEAMGKIYALFHPLGGRVVLKEIDPDNGQIVNEVEIPDLHNINNIKVHRNIVYFTYQVKTYPYYTNIYRLKI